MSQTPRYVFAGTPDFAVAPLQALIDRGTAPLAVYTQPDRPAGRGRKLTPSPVKACALSQGLAVRQPATLREPDAQAELAELEPDLFIVVAYGLILPQAVLDIPRAGCWNIHASLLPRWRGAAPIQRAIEAGDEETGVCIMHMEAGLDTGPVYLSRSLHIGVEDTSASLHDRLARLGAEALVDTLDALEQDRLPQPIPQEHAAATYAEKVTKAEAELDWNRSAVELARQVRAFNPWPVSWCLRGDDRLRVWRAEARPGNLRLTPGELVRSGPEGIDFATADGILRVLELQAAGTRRMTAAEFLNARSLA